MLVLIYKNNLDHLLSEIFYLSLPHQKSKFIKLISE